MAKSHPAQSNIASPDFWWARSNPAILALLACLAFFSLVLHNHHGLRLSGALWHGVDAADANEPVTLLAPALAPVSVSVDEEGKQRALAEYLARRYRVSSQVTANIVTNAYAAGRKYAVDPMLILAVISVESSFNPIAESTMGAKGLMQIIPRFHPEKFDPIGGEEVAFDPAANIRVGAQILREYIRRTGDVNEGLRLYVGATTDDTENGYALKVLAERERLHQVLYRYQSQTRQQLAQS